MSSQMLYNQSMEWDLVCKPATHFEKRKIHQQNLKLIDTLHDFVSE